MSDIVLNEHYLAIIGMGAAALPLIFAALQRESDYWFPALTAITGENPITEEDWGRVDVMTEKWLQWGREREYIVS